MSKGPIREERELGMYNCERSMMAYLQLLVFLREAIGLHPAMAADETIYSEIVRQLEMLANMAETRAARLGEIVEDYRILLGGKE